MKEKLLNEEEKVAVYLSHVWNRQTNLFICCQTIQIYCKNNKVDWKMLQGKHETNHILHTL